MGDRLFPSAVGRWVLAVTTHPKIRLGFMTGEILDLTQPGTILTDQSARFRSAGLVGDRLEEFADPEAASISTGPIRGEGMVGTDDLVAKSHIGFRSQKQGAIIRHSIQEDSWIAGKHLHMLGTDFVSLRDQLLFRVGEDDATAILPSDACDVSGGQALKLTLDFLCNPIGQSFACGRSE